MEFPIWQSVQSYRTKTLQLGLTSELKAELELEGHSLSLSLGSLPNREVSNDF